MRTMLFGACALAALASPLAASRGDGVAFDVSIAGIPIGDATLRVAAFDGSYMLEGAGSFGFLFWGGEGMARAEGATGGDRLAPSRFQLAYQGVTRPGRVEIAFDAGRAVRWESAPAPSPEYLAERVDVTEAHLQGVMDPLSALVIPASAGESAEAVCRRVLPVFNGYTRFDLALTGAVRTAEGAVDCGARYRPVAGHREGSAGVARLSAPGAVQVSLAPLAEGFWGPSRIAVATRFGTLEVVRR